MKASEEGVRPLNRPKGYRKLERRKEKQQKKKNWSNKGGYTAPIIVPATPGGVLAQRLQDIADKEAIPGLKFKVVEKGGKTFERILTKSNPTATGNCGRTDKHGNMDCVPCNQDGGGQDGGVECGRSNITYRWDCEYENCNYVYLGETAANLYTRSKEHMDDYNKRRDKSVIFRHQIDIHDGQDARMKVSMMKSFKDSLSRQISESVCIFRTEQKGEKKLINGKSEWHQPSLYTVRKEIGHG